MKDCIPEIQIELWEEPFQKSLENCRLYVCDHLSTTFAEALAANKPTVLFCNPQTNKLRPEAQPYFDLLRGCGILCDTPEAAASIVASVYDDVETWWGTPERQAAVRLFCARFARTSPDAISLWSNELLRMV
jgi:putative transferase (TIGR04331 family)